MGYLLAASLLWAFSFGLIKRYLGEMDPFVLGSARLALSALLFLPFLRFRKLSKRLTWHLVATGAVQYGVMYAAYIYAFRYMAAHEVAVFTVLTPLYVALLGGLDEHSRVDGRHVLAAILAILGCVFMIQRTVDPPGMLRGVLLLQLSNLAFAAGQLRYRAVMRRAPSLVRDRDVFALLFLGGFIFTAGPVLVRGLPTTSLSWEQVLVVTYLGLIPSGIAFFLWNVGARRVNRGTLGVVNNAKIPLAILVALVVFGERAAWGRLIIGGLALAGAAAATERWAARDRAQMKAAV